MIKSEYKYKQGLIDGLSIGLGYLSVAFGFGISASAAGLNVFQSVLISITNLTSAGQVAGISIIAASGTLIEMILAQLIINIRYALMGISLTQKLDKTFNTFHRMVTAFFITDEIYALASSKENNISIRYMYGLGLLPILGWSLGTFLGAATGQVLPPEITAVLGLAIYGMFIAVIIPQSVKSRGVLLAVCVSAVLSCLLYYLTNITQGFAVIICAISASALAAYIKPVEEDKEN